MRLHQFRPGAASACVAGRQGAACSRHMRSASTRHSTAATLAPSNTCCSANRRMPGVPRIRCSSCTPCGSTFRAWKRGASTRRGRLAAVLPEVLYHFVMDPDPEWEAPLDGSRLPQAPMPTPEQYDLRKIGTALDRTRTRAPKTPHCARHRRTRRNGRQQQLGGRARRAGGGALARERHASRPARAEHLVPRTLNRRVGGTGRQRRQPAWRTGNRRRQQRSRRLGIHQQLRRLPGPGRSSPDRKRTTI